jgi:uncharacterized protein (TIGR02271 family)
MADRTEAERIPLMEERLVVEKRAVPTGRVRVRTRVEEEQVWVREDLEREEVDVERVTIDREVDEVPQVRVENDVVIVPVVEELLVVERKLILKEELHVRRTTTTERVEQPVVLRRTLAEVERADLDDLPAERTRARWTPLKEKSS